MSMFGQPKSEGSKPLASLSATLLARKGQASPAMRRQGYGGFGAMSGGPDDLGWNDMGEPVAAEAPAPVALASVPPVLVEREALLEELTTPAETSGTPRTDFRPVSVATATRLGRETAQKTGKAAFTLRLDQDRHLRLRIASALHDASAQTLVTAALDRFLQSLPEVDALVAQIPPRTPRSTRTQARKGE